MSNRNLQIKSGGNKHGKLCKNKYWKRKQSRTSWNTLINRSWISINKLPAGASVPFIHSHKNNEEIYGIIAGKGKAIIDEEEINLTTGDWLRVSPAGKRQFFASEDSELTYICIQVKENSLEGFTMDDGVIY